MATKPRWENAAAFKRWADHILELAQQTPDDPIPECVILLSPDQRLLTAGERAEAEQRVLQWARRGMCEAGGLTGDED